MPIADPSGTIAPGFGGYLEDMLNRSWGLSKEQYTPYPGERFAPTSPLQDQAFKGIGALGSYTPTQFNTGLGPVGSVQDYMNPYLQNVVDIQAREARRQADISRNAEQARLAQAGAYGGSRQAIMEAERQRNLGTQIGDIQSKGLMAAYDQAQKQRLGESTLGLEAQRLGEMSRQFGAKQDVDVLGEQMKAGTIQRGIAQEPLDFGYKEWTESTNWPYKQLGFMQQMIGGMPIQGPAYTPPDSVFGSGVIGGLGTLSLYNKLFG